MRFGFCASPEHFETLARVGYDYAEWPLAGALKPEESQETVMPALLAKANSASIKPETYYIFLPGDLKVVGPQIDPARQERYLKSAFARVAALGGKVTVFGSGRSRQVPEGFSRDEANGQVIEFLKLAGPIAEQQGVTIAIEPLSASECNFINSVAEGVDIAQAVASPAVGVLSDLFHVSEQNQPYSETRDAGARLKHVHVAGGVGRRVPVTDDIPFLAEYFSALKAIDYKGRISVEGHWTDLPQDGPVALETLHKAWDAA